MSTRVPVLPRTRADKCNRETGPRPPLPAASHQTTKENNENVPCTPCRTTRTQATTQDGFLF